MKTKAMNNCNGIMNETIKIRNGWAGLAVGYHFRYNNIFETMVLKIKNRFISLY